MKRLEIKIKRLNTGDGNKGLIPAYATPGSAAVDLHACLDQSMVLPAGGRVRIRTGIAIELPGPETVALVFARSGLAAKFGIGLTNGVGVIDSDYRGEIQVLLSNHGEEDFTIVNGDRIAQMAFTSVLLANFILADELNDTARGAGGFGSTGV